jgi:hypothetical protein
MQRFSTWARWIAATIFAGVLIPVAVHFIEQQPQETANVVLKFLFYLGEQAWLRITVLVLGGLVAGLWLDWLLRKLDDTRTDERKVLGYNMTALADLLEELRFPMQQEKSRIRSYFASARKLGIWAPDDQAFLDLPSDRAVGLIVNYLRQVGTMLKDGNFKEAKQDAKKSKAVFDNAYAQHR